MTNIAVTPVVILATSGRWPESVARNGGPNWHQRRSGALRIATPTALRRSATTTAVFVARTTSNNEEKNANRNKQPAAFSWCARRRLVEEDGCSNLKQLLSSSRGFSLPPCDPRDPWFISPLALARGRTLNLRVTTARTEIPWRAPRWQCPGRPDAKQLGLRCGNHAPRLARCLAAPLWAAHADPWRFPHRRHAARSRLPPTRARFQQDPAR